MPAARIKGLEFLAPKVGIWPQSGSANLRVSLEDGGQSTFVIATPDQPARWSDQGGGYSFGTPVAFVRSLDRQIVAQAAEAMAAEMGGYWLRYFDSEGDESKIARTLRAKKAAQPKKRR